MSKDKAIKKTKTPINKKNVKKTPSKNSKKDLNDIKTKTLAKSKAETNTINKRSSRKGIKSENLNTTDEVGKTQEVKVNKETDNEITEKNENLVNMRVIESEQEVSPKESERVEEEENQLIEVPSENEKEEESIDLNETIIPPDTIENILVESESIWSKIKSKLSNVLSNLFTFITLSKRSEDNNHNNKFDPNITVIDPEELEELEEVVENKGETDENIPIPATPPENSHSDSNHNNNMHILLNISNDNDEDNNSVILYQHIPESERNDYTESTRLQQFDIESEKENQNNRNIKLFNFQTTSTPSYYSNIEQPPNLMKRKRFQLHINKNKSNKPIESEKRYFKLKYIPYTTIVAVPPSKRIKTVSIEKDEEISKSSKVIKPNIIESKQINNLSFLSSPKLSDKSRLNFDLTKDTKKIFSTLDILTTPSKLYSQFNNNNNYNDEEESDVNKKTKIDFTFVNKDINNNMSILSEKINEATEYVKKRNSLSIFDSFNNSITTSTTKTNKNTIEVDSPFSTHDVIEYSFSSATPSKLIVGSNDILSKEFKFSKPNDLKKDNNDNNNEFSFSLPQNVPRLEPDDSTYVFAAPL